MKIVLLCVVALVMVVQLPREGDAVCCYGKGLVWKSRCKDCTKAAPFCAKGKGCNIFGCNCMGGCREGPCPSAYNHNVHAKPVYEAPVGRDYESSYESVPYGHETAAIASNDYDIPASDLASGSESEMSLSNDYDVPASDVASGSESEMSSNDYDVPASDVASGSESETSSSNDYDAPASDVPSGSESEMSSSNDYDVPASDVASGSESEMSSSNDYDVPASDVASGSESEMSSSSDYDTSMVFPNNDDGGYGDKSEINSAEDVVSTADENGDGYMDIDEAERFLVKRGLAASGYRAKRSLRAIDLNNDNFISAEEIELYED